MAYLEVVSFGHDSRLEWFRLRCACGFRTGSVAVGFVGASDAGTDHDSWLLAWFDLRTQSLRSDLFAIPVEHVLRGTAHKWRDESVASHLRSVYGDCFVCVPPEPTSTDTVCPKCRRHQLFQECSEGAIPFARHARRRHGAEGGGAAGIAVFRHITRVAAGLARERSRSATGDAVNDVKEFARTLGYTPACFALGVVDNSVLDRQRAVWDNGEDNNTEHYRYSSFREFLTAHHPVSPDLAMALFELGATDADHVTGASMMADIVRLSECPPEVLAAAVASGRKHLIAIVERRKAEPTDEREPE